MDSERTFGDGYNLEIQRFPIEKYDLLVFFLSCQFKGPKTSIRVDLVSRTESNLTRIPNNCQKKLQCLCFQIPPASCRGMGGRETRGEDFPTWLQLHLLLFQSPSQPGQRKLLSPKLQYSDVQHSYYCSYLWPVLPFKEGDSNILWSFLFDLHLHKLPVKTKGCIE